MAKNKLNCWEYMQCGREPNGKNVELHGVCPATNDTPFDGFNQGVKGGRACWLLAGTFCCDKAQGTFAEKRDSCKKCDFYRLVNSDVGETNLSSAEVDVFALSHVGLVRKTNEDRYFVKEFPDNSILIAVADGLGGEVAGDFAAELLRGKLAGVEDIAEGEEEQQLARLVFEIDLAIMNEAEKDIALVGMGTTFIGVLIRKGFAYWVHVGDSRLYHLRNKEFIQITRDHNFARYLIDEEGFTPEKAMTYKDHHHLDQCIGQGFCEPDTGAFHLDKNDTLFLCTDGLHTQITHETTKTILLGSSTIEEKAKALLQAVLDSGGEDNITVMLLKINKEKRSWIR